MSSKYKKMVKKLSAMSDSDLRRVWAALDDYDPKEEYAPGISMDDWATEVCSQLELRDIYPWNEDDLFHTQKGGLVKWDRLNFRYVFVEPPPDLPKYKAGDLMPEEWGIV